MHYKVIRKSDVYELALGIQSDRLGHHLRFIARGSGFGSTDPEVKWRASLETDELAALHEFLGGVLDQPAEPPSDKAFNTEGTVEPTSSVEDFVWAWYHLSGGASNGVAWNFVWAPKMKGLAEFLNGYQGAHQRLPVGLFEFPCTRGDGRTVTETVDADAIHKRAAALKVCFAERGDYRLNRILSALP